MSVEKLVLLPGGVRLRHIKKVPSTTAGAVRVLGAYYAAQDRAGINGRQNFQGGSYGDNVNEEAPFTLRFHNGAGGDGVAHRQRFLILTDPDAYRPGDEWFEIYRATSEGGAGELLFVGTPTKAKTTKSEIVLTGWDGFWLLRRAREFAGAAHVKAPHDVIDLYSRAVEVRLAEDFENAASPAFAFGATDAFSNDGRFVYRNVRNATGVNAGSAELAPPAGTTTAELRGVLGTEAAVGRVVSVSRLGSGGFNDGSGSLRFEVAVRLEVWNDLAQMIELRVVDSVANAFALRLWPAATALGSKISCDYASPSFGVTAASSSGLTIADLDFRLAIEVHDNMALFYINERLIGQAPFALNGPGLDVVGSLRYTAGNSPTGVVARAWTSYFLVRRKSRLLNRAVGDQIADARVADAQSALPRGGLVGHYAAAANDQKFYDAVSNEATFHAWASLPQRNPPYAERLDASLDMTANAGGYGTWAAPGAPYRQEFMAVYWTGAIWLDLASTDYVFRVLGPSGSLMAADDGAIRVFIGRTFWGQQCIEYPGTGGTPINATRWLKGGNASAGAGAGTFPGPLAGLNRAGWYPIVVYYTNAAGNGGFRLEASTNGTTWSTVSDANGLLSPLGVYDQAIRYDSHYELVRGVLDTFALQGRIEPRSLESGGFPGEFRTQLRVGRDTEVIVTGEESTDLASEIDAEDTVDSLFADAAGIADPRGGGQLTAEALRFSSLDEHMIASMDYESLAEITIPELLRRRLESLTALRGSAWEQIGLRPPPHRQLVDTFPLTGAAAEFAWRAGDGVRLALPELAVADTTPRQILGVTWPIYPDAVGVPEAAFRQRPRSPKETMRQVQRRQLQQIRNYQGTLTVVSTTEGWSPAMANISDSYVRHSLPVNDPRDLVKAELVVLFKTDADVSAWELEWNGAATGVKVKRTGRYDITGLITFGTATATPRYNYFRLIAGATGTNQIAYQIDYLVRI